MNFLKLCFSLKGKINRGQFLQGSLISMACAGLVFAIPGLYVKYTDLARNTKPETLELAIENVTRSLDESSQLIAIYKIITLPIILMLCYIAVCLSIKRLRHIGISPWWFLGLVAFVFSCLILGFEVIALFAIVAAFIFYAATPTFQGRQSRY